MKGFALKGDFDKVLIKLSAICERADGMTVAEYLESICKNCAF